MTYASVKEQLLDAALIHVAFDGWSDATFDAAVQDADVAPELAHVACPRGVLDLAIAYHLRADVEMLARFEREDVSALRYSEKVTTLVQFRLEAVSDKEAVRRGTTLFTLPHHAADGAKLIWGTAGAIWNALGDTSTDSNWYTKRATLSAVYSSTVLFWLGDTSEEHADTWAFLERRIDDVMRFEKVKAQVNGSAVLKPLLAGPKWALSFLKAPSTEPRNDLPGRWSERT
ncbi:COQ9 family protein [Planktotalea sp.]|uniref:COQ9 family protein n=1 Tax=Planktotalea sp. TaxID=2029877 RepID=UPI0025F30870|nr:COQ9 family protein [Planktotalea sp.]